MCQVVRSRKSSKSKKEKKHATYSAIGAMLVLRLLLGLDFFSPCFLAVRLACFLLSCSMRFWRTRALWRAMRSLSISMSSACVSCWRGLVLADEEVEDETLQSSSMGLSQRKRSSSERNEVGRWASSLLRELLRGHEGKAQASSWLWKLLEAMSMGLVAHMELYEPYEPYMLSDVRGDGRGVVVVSSSSDDREQRCC